MEYVNKLIIDNNTNDAKHAVDLTQGGVSLLPLTPKDAATPTWYFYECFIHVLEGINRYDFSTTDSMEPHEWVAVDWREIKYIIQKIKEEEPEVFDEIEFDSEVNKKAMQYCINYLKLRFGHQFGIPDADELTWTMQK